MAGYIGPIPVPQATQTRETFTATASQTTFNTGGYTSGFIDVFMNGVKLASADFTATNGSDVVLATGAAVNDIIEVVAYTAFEVLNQNFTGNTSTQDLTVSGNLTVTGTTVTIDTATAQNVDLGDGDKIRLGDGDDLQIYHDGSNSYVDDTGTGRLYLRGNDRVQIQKYTGEDMVTALADGAVNLYHNNSKKFETTATGVAVSGSLVSDGANLNGGVTINDAGANLDFRVESTGNANMLFVDASADTIGIGTTQMNVVGNNAAGVNLLADGMVGISRAGVPLKINRTAEGGIIELYEAGTPRAQIDINGDRLLLRSTGDASGIRFDASAYTPFKNGTAADGTVDLGYGSGRFKDAYIAGNVIISGSGKGINFAEPTSQSGSVSQILDAYEEGTWTPTTNYGTIANNCWYIKIGNSVTVGGNIWNPTNSSSTYPFAVNALPFTAKSGKSSAGAIIGAYIADPYYSVYISGGTSQLYFYKNPSTSAYHILTHADLASNSDIHFAITYYSA
jgi:hypothetical protein